MARQPYDPLHFVPSPEVVREKLHETMTLAERLRLLLELAERMRLPLAIASTTVSTTQDGGVADDCRASPPSHDGC